MKIARKFNSINEGFRANSKGDLKREGEYDGRSKLDEFDQKTITSFGTIGAATNTNYHGTFVMGVAAGEDDGVNSTQGVAPEADLHVSDYWNKGSYTNHPDHWAAATAHASTAVA